MKKIPTRYDNQRIATEIRSTAANESYYGNALYVSLEMPEIVAAPEQRAAIQRYLNGSPETTDHIRLQEAAELISPTQTKSKTPFTDANIINLAAIGAEDYIPISKVKEYEIAVNDLIEALRINSNWGKYNEAEAFDCCSLSSCAIDQFKEDIKILIEE